MYGYDELLQLFKDLDLPCRLYLHPAVMTVEEAEREGRDIEGLHCKCLFLCDKDKRHWLVAASAEKKLDLKLLAERLGCKRLRFGDPERMYELLGIRPGGVTPLGVVNDREGAVTLVLEKAMLEAPLVNYHPLVNTATVGISPADLLRFAEHTGHTPVIVDLA